MSTQCFLCFTVSRLVANGFVYSTYWLISYYLSERHNGYFTAKGGSATLGTDEADCWIYGQLYNSECGKCIV